MKKLLLLISFFLTSIQYTNSQTTFYQRLLADPNILALGDNAFDIIEGKNGFPINFVTITNNVTGNGSNLNTVFNVLNYGAKNDGSEDATNGINSAYQAAKSSGGGTVIIPSGTYNISGQILPESNVRTIADGANFVRTAHTNGNSNAPGSSLVLFDGIDNFSWTGGTISNSNGLYRGRGMEAINSSNFELNDINIYYMGLDSAGSPSPSVGLFLIESTNFYVHDIYAEAFYAGDTNFPHPTGNTPFRFTGCSLGVVYALKGLSSDNIIDFTADNSGNDRTQHDVIVIDVDGFQNAGYGAGSAVIVGTAGSQGNHPGTHYNLYFLDITMNNGGNLTQPQFEVMNSSLQSSAKVYDIYFIGIETNCDSFEGFRIFSSSQFNNGGIDNIHIYKSFIKNTKVNGKGLYTLGNVSNIYIDEFTNKYLTGDPKFNLSNSTNLIIVNNGYFSQENYFIKNRRTEKRIRPETSASAAELSQCPVTWSGNIVQWQLEYKSVHSFYLKNKFTGNYLRPQTDQDLTSIVSTDVKDNWSLWSFVPTTNGYGYLVNANTKKYISPSSITDDLSTGGNYIIKQKSTDFSGTWTQWLFEEVTTQQANKIDIGKKKEKSQIPITKTILEYKSTKELSTALTEKTNYNLIIYNVNGLEVFNQKSDKLKNTIHLDFLKTGVYIIKMVTNNAILTKKIILL